MLTILYDAFFRKSLYDALYRTVMVSAMILLILLGGTMFPGVLAASGGVAVRIDVAPSGAE